MSAQLQLHVLLLCASLFLFNFATFSQQSFRGKIESETGAPLQGASIQVKGNPATQTSAKADGTFSILANPSDVLVITYVGYEPLEVLASNANRVVLKGDSRNMNEVVVTALEFLQA